jgi:hypothetical protein
MACSGTALGLVMFSQTLRVFQNFRALKQSVSATSYRVSNTTRLVVSISSLDLTQVRSIHLNCITRRLASHDLNESGRTNTEVSRVNKTSCGKGPALKYVCDYQSKYSSTSQKTWVANRLQTYQLFYYGLWRRAFYLSVIYLTTLSQ